MTKPKGTTSPGANRKPKAPIKCAMCDLPIIGPLASSVNEDFHAICMDDNGLTIDQRKVAVDTASRQYLIETRDDLKTRFILNDIGMELFSGDGEWESDEHHRAACMIFKAMVYIGDRIAYQEHVEDGESLQINEDGGIRWAYPGECREYDPDAARRGVR